MDDELPLATADDLKQELSNFYESSVWIVGHVPHSGKYYRDLDAALSQNHEQIAAGTAGHSTASW